MKKVRLTWSGSALVALMMACAPASSASPRVTLELSGVVTHALVTTDFASWDNWGIAVGDPWVGRWSYDTNAMGITPPGFYDDAGFELQISIDGNGFRTLGTPRYCRITADAGTGTSSIYHAFDEFHGGLIETPWDEASIARARTSADFFTLQLFDLTLGPLGPGGLPSNLAFSSPSPAGNLVNLHGTLGLDSFSFDLEVSRVQLIPEPSVVALIGLGGLGMALWRSRR